MPVATHQDVARLARRELTPTEQTFATEAIAALTATLERVLNRILDPREITETVPIGVDGRINPTRGPVVEMLEITTTSGYSYTDAATLLGYDAMLWPYGELEIRYLAGREPDAGIRDTIAGAVARTVLTPAAVATGVIGSYSVEGTSITYRTSEQGAAGLLVGELKGLGRLRRPVLL